MNGGSTKVAHDGAVARASSDGQLELLEPGPEAAERRRTLPPEDEMYRAFLERDTRYDGILFTAVRTTGSFCLPSCRAKKPARQTRGVLVHAKEARGVG